MTKEFKEIADEALRLCSEANRLPGGYGSATQKAADKTFWDYIYGINAAAGPGLAIGRFVKFGVRDGYARYIISKINKRTVHLVHIPYGDGYRSSMVDASGECDRGEVEDRIDWEDTSKMAEESAERAMSVVIEDDLPVVEAE